MARRSGYEYSYCFWMDDEIIPLYKGRTFCIIKTEGPKNYLFEIRTDLKLKRVDDDGFDDDGGAGQIMGSERFGAGLQEGNREWVLEQQMSLRLKDYWMSDDEIQSLAHDALNFAKQLAGDPEHASLSTIAVVVGLEVCTVQQEGEPINATIDRAIRPECLIPLYLWPIIPEGIMRFHEYPYLDHKNFLMFLPRIRVEDDAGLALMDVCPVCSRNSIIGAQISFLPCKHACHSHCVFRWFHRSCLCPSCGFRIPTDSERLRILLAQFSSDNSE